MVANEQASGSADEEMIQMNTTRSSHQIRRSLRSASVSTTMKFLEFNPAGGMWQATGTAIAHAPNSTDLTSAHEVGFDAHGRSVRRIGTQDEFQNSNHNEKTLKVSKCDGGRAEKLFSGVDGDCLGAGIDHVPHASWKSACKNVFLAAFRVLCTPTGLFIAIYGLNVVAWGAMLFFLLLDVGTMSKDRKEVWIEIDSQILNGLFCLTSWGLAPWRFRDTYWLLMGRLGSGKRSKEATSQLARRNASWFRMTVSYLDEEAAGEESPRKTSTGKIASPTSRWKMDFVVINMLLNSLFQIGMATFMWAYDSQSRPSFGVGLFIGLGCFSSLLAGIMSWWEGRKVKKVEGPILEEL
ncbi:unnamed protein product [Penicillium olsonii]|nr:unnamed protein product [Penicillium olsonii]